MALEKAFCTLQTNYDQILCHEGGNRYKTQHIGKEKILRTDGVQVLRERAREATPEALDMYDLNEVQI